MRINKFILTLIVLLSGFGYAYSQYQPTGAKTAFKNGIALGSKDSTNFGANDSLVLTIDRNGKLLWRGLGASAAWRSAGSSADLLAYLLKSDSAIYFDKVVRTFGTQTIGGTKTFSADLVVNGLTVGRGAGNAVSNAVLGNGIMPNNTTGVFNTAIGYLSLESNTTANSNTAIGTSSLIHLTTGGSNIGIGVSAGSFATSLAQNQTSTRSIYIGGGTRASANGNSNEVVIGDTAIGNGSNTVTIGNSSVTGNYFNGFLKQTSVTSALVKASATGQFEAATAGDIPNLSGSYVDLTTTQTVGGAKTFTSALAGTSATFSGDISGGRLFSSQANAIVEAYDASGTSATLRAYSGANYWDWAVKNNSNLVFDYNGTTKFTMSNTGNITLTGSLSGTSASFSGEGLFGGAATDGVSKLRVTGAATFSSSVTATGFIVSSDLRYKDIVSQDGDLFTYTLKSDQEKKLHFGYVAQEVETTLPNTVTINSEGYKAVNYIEVMAYKIRQLEKKIEQLEKLNK